MSEWISVEDHLPALFVPVLVSSALESPCSSRLRCQAVAWINNDGDWERWTKNGGRISWKGFIAYWMPIPPTPDTPKETV